MFKKNISYLLITTCIPLLTAFSCQAQKNDTQTLPETPKTIAQAKSKTTILHPTTELAFNQAIKSNAVVKFTADWCSACKVIQPLYEQVANKYGSTYNFVVVDIDKLPNIAKTYNIKGIPAFIFFRNGKLVKGNLVGSRLSENDFVKKLDV